MTVKVSRSVRPRRAVVGAGVLAVAALLGACSGQPGAAAVVDGTAISTDEVQTASTELGPYFDGATPTNVLAVLLQAPVVDRLAADNGVGVSDEQAQAALDTQAQAIGRDTETFSDAALSVVRYSLAVTALQALPDAADIVTELTEQVAAQDIQVSPRYGDIGADNMLVAPSFPWIVTTQAG